MSEESIDFGNLDNSFDEDAFSMTIPAEPAQSQHNNQDSAEERARQLEIENAILKDRQNNRFEHTYVPPAQPNQYQSAGPAKSKQEVDAEIAAQMALNPADFLRENNRALISQVQQETAKYYRPVQIASARQAINMYKNENIRDPEVRKEFDKIVSEYTEDQMANFDITQADKVLKAVHTYAKGQVLDRGYIPEEARRNIPNYGGSGTGARSAPPGQKQFVFENEVERNYARIQQSLGVSKAEIAKDIEDMRRNPDRNITVTAKEM